MSEPVTLAEARAQVNIIDDADTTFDTFLTSLIAPARAYVERLTRFSFVAQSRTESFSRWEDVAIWRQPIESIDSITYVGADGDPVDFTDFQSSIAPSGVPTVISAATGTTLPKLPENSSITVSYTTGTIDSASEEYLIGKRAMLLLIGDWFENRENFIVGAISNGVQFALDRLLERLAPVSAY